MRQMKDSGVEWIGEIPGSKLLLRNKYKLRFTKGKLPEDTNTESIGFPYIGASDLDSDGYSTYTTDDSLPDVRNDDLLVLWDGARAGLCGTHKSGKASSTIVRVRGDNTVYQPFLYWYYKGFEGYMYHCVNGTTIPHMQKEYIESIGFINWTLDEQRCIADYLDTKCAKLDALIARQQEVIEKLKAYKLSVITEAVTKGVNLDVPMKDSGVEWIGQFPAGWQISHIGNLAEIGAGGTPDRNKPEYWTDGTIRWMASGEINYEYVYDTAEKITELGMMHSNAKLLPANTVMLGLIGQGKTKGLTAILKTECACNQNLAYLIADPNLLHYRYLFYCFKAMYHYIRGLVGDSQAGIYQGFLKKQYIPLPDTAEQANICDYLDEKLQGIETLIRLKETQITKLENYKKSLIYEVVTGKREVQP